MYARENAARVVREKIFTLFIFLLPDRYFRRRFRLHFRHLGGVASKAFSVPLAWLEERQLREEGWWKSQNVEVGRMRCKYRVRQVRLSSSWRNKKKKTENAFCLPFFASSLRLTPFSSEFLCDINSFIRSIYSYVHALCVRFHRRKLKGVLGCRHRQRCGNKLVRTY